MCKAVPEGGQRCAAHGRDHFDSKTKALEAAKASGDVDKVADARVKWEKAAVEYASTDAGHNVMTNRGWQAEENGNDDEAAMYWSLAARGERMQEANRASRLKIRLGQAAKDLAEAKVAGDSARIAAAQEAWEDAECAWATMG